MAAILFDYMFLAGEKILVERKAHGNIRRCW